MPKFKAKMDANYEKEIQIRNIKRVFQRENGDWGIETDGGEIGTASKNGYKKILRLRPEIIEEAEPHNALIAWLLTRNDDGDDDSKMEFDPEAFCEYLNGLTEAEASKIIFMRMEGFARQRHQIGLTSQEWEDELMSIFKEIDPRSDEIFELDKVLERRLMH